MSSYCCCVCLLFLFKKKKLVLFINEQPKEDEKPMGRFLQGGSILVCAGTVARQRITQDQPVGSQCFNTQLNKNTCRKKKERSVLGAAHNIRWLPNSKSSMAFFVLFFYSCDVTVRRLSLIKRNKRPARKKNYFSPS